MVKTPVVLSDDASRVPTLIYAPEVIVCGEAVDEELSPSPSLDNLLAVAESCDSVSALRKALANSSDPVADLAQLCREADGETALLAVQVLVQMGTPEATLELISLISDLPRSRFKTDVLYEAEQLNAPQSVPVLLEALRVAADGDVQQLCQQTLASMADSTLIARIQHNYSQTEDADRRSALAETLRYINAEDTVPALIALVKSADSLTDPLALAATDTLGTIGTKEAALVLFQILEATETRVDAEILVRSIRRVTNGDALDILKQMAQSGGDDELSPGTAARQALRNFSEQTRLDSDL